jgi:outer membrane protein TolC
MAEVGVARTELYPQFQVSGDLVLESRQSSDLFRDDSAAWSLAPNFRWHLFSAGEIRNKIKQAKARAGQALAEYENTVQNAVAEVESSMVAVEQEWERLETLQSATRAASQSVESVNSLYQQGLVNFQNLLDTERTLFQTEDLTAESRGNVARSYIQLIKALGGGTNEGLSAAPEETESTTSRSVQEEDF